MMRARRRRGAAMMQVVWECMLGGRNLKEGLTLTAEVDSATGSEAASVQARIVSKAGKVARVQLQWAPSHLTLAELLERLGHTPLPPYMRRAAVPSDRCVPAPLLRLLARRSRRDPRL